MTDEELAHYSAALDEVWRLREALAIEAAVIERRLGPAADNGRWTPAKEQITRMREAAQGDTKSHRSFAGEARRHARDAAGMQGLTRWQWENER
jgi:hypothetical protein